MEEEQQLKQWDKVQFDVEGCNKSPFGFGIVQSANKGKTLIKPDYPLSIGTKLINIKKVS